MLSIPLSLFFLIFFSVCLFACLVVKMKGAAEKKICV